AMSTVLFDRLNDRFGNHAHIGDIRGRGLFATVEFVEDRAGKTPFAPELRLNARVKARALELGLDCYAVGGTLDGKAGDHVMLAPAFIVTPVEIDRIVAILGDAVESVLADLPS
ncbi:MAG: aspartate aminotransferase family protein, partial [Rhodospirillales bacterium]|nr:aspartate aminotransferase family protein [Rhodospirillales bacterium]